jgi:molybdopterin-containing oxidoreductase family iron-sulfur binding subunit
MVIDLKKCIGCGACTLACKAENATGPGIFWNRVEDEEIGTYPLVSRRYIPRGCMHCENPPCVDVCPTGASHKEDSGIVSIDQEKCVGCQSCIVACYYGARHFIKENKGYFENNFTPSEKMGLAKHRPGVVEKCTFCKDRLDQGKEPACVQACSCKARIFGDLDDPKSEVSKLVSSGRAIQLYAELGSDPSVYYLVP